MAKKERRILKQEWPILLHDKYKVNWMAFSESGECVTVVHRRHEIRNLNITLISRYNYFDHDKDIEYQEFVSQMMNIHKTVDLETFDKKLHETVNSLNLNQ